jgi:hypothetical protein
VNPESLIELADAAEEGWLTAAEIKRNFNPQVVAELCQRVLAAESALKFYAEQWHYIDQFHGHGHYEPSQELVDDRGGRARALLSPKEQP